MRRLGMVRLARRNAERRLAVFGCMNRLFGFAMKRVLPQMRVVFLFLEPVRGPRAFFVPARHVTRRGFAERFRFGAFEGDNFLGHVYSLDSGAGAASDSSASVSPPSSSVKPNNEVTDCRTREALLCFSSCDWHSTVKRANGIASNRACGIGFPDISQTP